MTNDRVVVEDLESKNGPAVAGQATLTPIGVTDGDRIRFGSVELTLRFADRGASTETGS